MKLTRDGLRDLEGWEKAGVALPDYDLEKITEKAATEPRWAHFGIGNIFRIFIGSIADDLLDDGHMYTGLSCVETFDEEIVDRVFRPYDNLVLSVILRNDGTQDRKVFGCFAEALKASEDRERLKEIFRSESLELVSFTITEKGYALRDASGAYLPSVRLDLSEGPDKARTAIAIVAAMLLERYKAGGYPLALVSMDNCSHNGERLRDAVLEVAGEWVKSGFAGADYLEWLSDEARVAFPWTMIDKITPRPEPQVQQALEQDGIEDMDIVVTAKKTYIAPFANAEGPQYLVIEDSFPNGRPPFELSGVYMADRETVRKSERMKVTACLNPIHTALAPYGCVLGFEYFADEMKDPQLGRLAAKVGLDEGMEFVEDPGILSPHSFIVECLYERFPNPYLGDTPQRIAVDTSQMVGIRFGETIKACVRKYGSAEKLQGIALAIAGWLRYLQAVDDNGQPFELSPDPMNEELQAQIRGASGSAESVHQALSPILSNASIFGCDLYEAGLGSVIEEMYWQECAGPGSVRQTLIRYLGE